ncbi:MAG: PIG-L family deacetylase, partial [Anaerolineales bacterium]|nr:PIG-L family deacetylase [Anaerolineales bacterium]
HYDDAVFSCCGGIGELRQAGEEVQVWTICGGKPPRAALSSPYVQELHSRWGFGAEAVALRQAEDAEALRQLGVTGISFSVPDCIYRLSKSNQPLYTSDDSLFGELQPDESTRIAALSKKIMQRVSPQSRLICPLGIGNHVDHQLTRLAAERTGIPLWYYADIPYIFRHPDWQEKYLLPSFQAHSIPISKIGFEIWIQAISAYQSQLSTFWDDFEHLRQVFYAHWQSNPALRLWHQLV